MLNELAKQFGNKQLVFPQDSEHEYDFLRISKINIAIIQGKRLVFEVRIPIVEETEFSAYHLISLPSLKYVSQGGLYYIA